MFIKEQRDGFNKQSKTQSYYQMLTFLLLIVILFIV